METNMNTAAATEKRLGKAADIMGKAIAKLAKDDPELARAISDAVCAVTALARAGKL